MNDQTIITYANTISDLFHTDYSKSYGMYRDCLKRYGVDYAVKVARLAEVYLQTKCGQMERAEAARKQNEILEEANI